MEEDQKDTVADQLAPDADTQEEQVDDTEESSDSTEETQDAEVEERLLAGKYKSVEDLEKAYKEAESFIGNRKETEAKAREYDRLVAQQARAAGQPVKGRPKLSSYIDKTDGTIDTERYDRDMDAYERSKDHQTATMSSQAAQEQVDMRKAEADYPYLLSDKIAARSIIASYRSGEYGSIYEAAVANDEYRKSLVSNGQKIGAETEKRELSKKIRGNTERSTGKREAVDTGEMTEAKFAKLSKSEQAAYLNSNFKDPQF